MIHRTRGSAGPGASRLHGHETSCSLVCLQLPFQFAREPLASLVKTCSGTPAPKATQRGRLSPSILLPPHPREPIRGCPWLLASLFLTHTYLPWCSRSSHGSGCHVCVDGSQMYISRSIFFPGLQA